MSISYATQYDIELYSKNKLCNFYVVKDTDTEKYHVFVVVQSEDSPLNKKGYCMASHDDESSAINRKIMLKNQMNMRNSLQCV